MQHSLPPGFRIKRPSDDDFSVLLAMLQICDMAEFGKIKMSETQLRTIWELPGHDLAQDAWLIMAPADRLAAMAFIGHIPPVSRLFAGMQVHPAYAGLGLYDYLLELSLERAQTLIPEAREEVRVSLSLNISERNAEQRRVLEGAGFEHVRSHWTMRIDMDQPAA